MPYQENKSSSAFFEKVNTCLERNTPFVLYKLPAAKEVIGIMDEPAAGDQYNRFIFCPFESDQKAYELMFNSKLAVSLKELPVVKSHGPVSLPSDAEAKDNFIKLVEEAQQALAENEFQKVVLSRAVKIPGKQDPQQTFCRLARTYSNAFCYWWFHPETGHWLGASPELLLAAQDNEVTIMSVAGTRKSKPGECVNWDQKEIEEQDMVSAYIRDILSQHGTDISEEGPYTIQAGSLVHIGTQFKASLQTDPTSLVKELHPTPAVCGVPKEKASRFIKQGEGYKREYYTGYLGLLSSNPENPSSLYVNLRCMKFDDNAITVYVGCGITAASDPEMEWQETVDKCQTMFKILDISQH
ncbi:MAG: isochorismate synthase [Bacteroidia bacterium]|nr:isochorismate synthase [Bacteroidia bacterium]